jgi:hypothetical protein
MCIESIFWIFGLTNVKIFGELIGDLINNHAGIPIKC